jgi:hypothetical protein
LTLRLNGSTSGYTEIDAPAVAGNNSIALPTGNGSAYQILRNGATAGSLEYTDKLVSGTVNAGGTNPFPPTGGPTVVDFTGIPSWAKRITVMFSGVSTNGTSNYQVQLGAGSITTSGYTSGAVSARATALSGPITTATSGILSYTDFTAATDLASGFVQIFNVSGNSWIGTAVTGNSAGSRTTTGTGTISLSGTLDRVRITTVNGTDAFDSGSINILYE